MFVYKLAFDQDKMVLHRKSNLEEDTHLYQEVFLSAQGV